MSDTFDLSTVIGRIEDLLAGDDSTLSANDKSYVDNAYHVILRTINNDSKLLVDGAGLFYFKSRFNIPLDIFSKSYLEYMVKELMVGEYELEWEMAVEIGEMVVTGLIIKQPAPVPELEELPV